VTREQIIFKMRTKNWQTVNRRYVNGQTVPKSWPCRRKRPCTNISSDELAGREDGWMMKNGFRDNVILVHAGCDIIVISLPEALQAIF